WTLLLRPITNDLMARSARLLETAKRHQLNSEKYLSYLLECLPNVEPLVNKEVLEAYLPWTKVVQEKCK
ncbi:transposase domain-containing protein, partial [Streptococcus pneumoniae]|uniref:transposase domain-containing protein n=1 Tax=Streptococcus pneumoniae TaxID=1313 RepID=UPI001D17C31F